MPLGISANVNQPSGPTGGVAAIGTPSPQWLTLQGRRHPPGMSMAPSGPGKSTRGAMGASWSSGAATLAPNRRGYICTRVPSSTTRLSGMWK
jgi:hypothetical protein